MASHRDGSRLRRMMTVLALLATLAGLGGYAVADIKAIVPGILTTDPVPKPYPALGSAPGAAAGPAAVEPVLSALSPDAPVPDTTALTAALSPLLADPALGPSVGASVVDVSTGTTLFASAATTAKEPASVAKVLTCAAALQALGPAATIETTAVIAPGSSHLVLVGAGDVLLGSGENDPTSVIGRAGLGDLAEQVAAELTRRGQTTVSVALDDSLLAGLGWGESMGPGWSNADLTHGFVAPVTGLAVDAGRIRRENYSPRVADPGLDATQVFSDALRQNGITVDGPNMRERAPAGAEPIGTVRSAPVAELVGYLLATSDNNAAEALSRLVAVHGGGQAGFAQGGAAVLAVLSGLGLDTAGSTLADGSGLSDGSVVSPALLTGTLTAAASDEHPNLRALLEGLAVGGLTGTLTDRFDAASGAAGVGVVRAKTGSLTGVSTLAGTLVTADGRLLAFAVMADQVPATDPARQALDRIAAQLVGCGCR